MDKPSRLGWIDKRVRHDDGREGVIASEYIGFGFALLTIKVASGGEAHVQLNCRGRDGGERGWLWWCENMAHGARYIPLGDHNDHL